MDIYEALELKARNIITKQEFNLFMDSIRFKDLD